MRHPSERFIKSLLLMGKNDDEVKDLVVEHGLPPLTDEYTEYLVRLRLDTVTPMPKGYTGAREEDRQYLRKHSIDGIVHPDMVVARATTLLELPYIRRDVFLGLLGRVDPDELADHITHKFGQSISAVHINTVKHYYFDVDIVSPEGWFDIFSRIPNEIESQTQHACLVGGPVVASYRLGIERTITIKDAVTEVVKALHTTIHEVKDWPASPAKMKLLSDAMGSLAKAHSVLNTSDQELAAVASELRTFKLARSSSKPTPLALLSKVAK